MFKFNKIFKLANNLMTAKNKKVYGRQINRIVIHCTASSQNASVEAILNYFKNVKGWSAPGYHYMISPNGDIENTWPISKVSNGVKGKNSDSLHIAYIGGKNGDNRTDKQKESMLYLIKHLKDQLGDIPVVGHRDLSPDKNNNGVIERQEWVKRCPSFEVTEWLKQNK